MPNIKTKTTFKDIKVLNKSAELSKSTKDAFVRTKDKADETQQSTHDTPHAYATDKASENAKELASVTAYKAERFGRKSTKKVYNDIKAFRKNRKAEKVTDNTIKTVSKGTIKKAQKSVKTAERTSKTTIKTTRQAVKTTAKTAQATAKSSQKAVQAAKVAAKASVQAEKTAVKATIVAVKTTIVAIKGLVTLIAAGGWVAIVVILVICMVALIFGSCFGIFFSNEDTGNQNGTTMSTVISQINSEFSIEIECIKSENPHDEVDGLTTPQNWKEILAVYAVKCTTDPDNSTDIATIDESKVEILKKIFWDMNTLTFSIETVISDTDNSDISTPTSSEPSQQTSKTILHIKASNKSHSEIAAQYAFNTEQNKQLDELLKPEYDDMWSALLSG